MTTMISLIIYGNLALLTLMLGETIYTKCRERRRRLVDWEKEGWA